MLERHFETKKASRFYVMFGSILWDLFVPIYRVASSGDNRDPRSAFLVKNPFHPKTEQLKGGREELASGGLDGLL